MTPALGLLALLLAGAADEARVSLDVKEASLADVVGALAELGEFQAVFDPGVSCKLTLKVHKLPWREVLDSVLRACSLGREEQNDILRIAPVARLAEEAAAEQKLDAARARKRTGRVTLFRLSYARAAALAPILNSQLSPGCEVTWDERTNTLIIID